MPRIINHASRIKNRRSMMIGKIRPGMFVEFGYAKARGDKKPLVMVLANGVEEPNVNSKNKTLLHGINLNYLTEYYIDKMARDVTKKALKGQVLEFGPAHRDEYGRFVAEAQSYTRLDIPEITEARKQGTPISLAEIRVIVSNLYRGIHSSVLKKIDAYRTYDVQSITALSAVLYRFPTRRYK